MKLSLAISCLLVGTAGAFAPIAPTSHSFQLASTASPPERVAPGAGSTPEWEGRQGLAPEEFLESDMDKPDRSGMWECPLTRWDSEG